MVHYRLRLTATPSLVSRISKRPAGGGARVSKFDSELIVTRLCDKTMLPQRPLPYYYFEFQCPSNDVINATMKNPSLVAVDFPLQELIPYLTRLEISGVAKVHGMHVYARYNVAQARNLMLAHICDSSCQDTKTLMSLKNREPSRRTTKQIHNQRLINKKLKVAKSGMSSATRLNNLTAVRHQAKRYRFLRRVCENRLRNTEFPPVPPSESALHKIITNMASSFKPDRFMEDGCAVCGRLTELFNLTPLADFKGSLEHLQNPSVTRKERFSAEEDIQELVGPVLAAGCDKICVECEKEVLKMKIPRMALANFGWIGEVPPQLQGLTYSEQLLIARVRHNRIVVRVNSGRVRMHANAIMFAQPALKIYLKLPPSRSELNEVLAIVFTGPAAPTPEEFARTPMLVSRQRVADALEWLKLNNEDYSDLEISQENLMSYALKDVPVVVDWKYTEKGEDHSIPLEARSLDDKHLEHGTSSGECTFAVHGLTGAEYSGASMATIIGVAMQHLTNKGSMLGVGRNDVPESMYSNVKAYPGMFPWLFPYGKGGIGHAAHKNIVGDMTHKRHLLLYHDKRFQMDTYFPMVAFNQEQLKGSAWGSKLLVKRSKFEDVAARLLSINPEVAGNIADRMAAGEHVAPESEAEKLCFNLMHDLDAVGAHVMGSATSKKHQRNQIWSTTAFKGAPTWFITNAWDDARHPLAMYYAQTDTVYRPALLKSDARNLLMSKNPVAAARFFHYMVQVFIHDVLGWESEKPGLYGHTDAFYGTVEQQGRLTLHLHMLTWIKNSASPQEIRDKLTGGDSIFERKMIAYLEAAHQGEFIHGPKEAVELRTKYDPLATPEDVDAQCTPTYTVPMLSVPAVPPPMCKDPGHPLANDNCVTCLRMTTWWTAYEHEVDDLVLRSNLHTCRESIQDRQEVEAKQDWRHLKPKAPTVKKKRFHERRGCLSKTGICKARFPRDIFEKTTVEDDGHINMKKLEEKLNTFSRVLTFFSRCNTDVTSLLSGTSVKAVISYVSDYISKLGLKSYQAFASVHDVFKRNEETLNDGAEGVEIARTLMRQMINSMSTKMEIGSPMASMYILGNPDHYKSHNFVNFYWRPYVAYVKRFWTPLMEPNDDKYEDKQTIHNQGGTYVASSMVDDYIFRPLAYESVNLFEWIQCSDKKPRSRKELREFDEQVRLHDELIDVDSKSTSDAEIDDNLSDAEDGKDFEDDRDPDQYDNSDFSMNGNSDDDSDWQSDDEDKIVVAKEKKKLKTYRNVRLPFVFGHALFNTHSVHCDFRKLSETIPNFIGGAMPRADKGDRDYYCMTMLTMFVPWRQPSDLKDTVSTWDQTFLEHKFTDRQLQLMRNFNIRYECNDARDDHYAQMKQKMAERGEYSTNTILGTHDDLKVDDMMLYGAEDMPPNHEIPMGKKTEKLMTERLDMHSMLQNIKWLNISEDAIEGFDPTPFTPPGKPRKTWTEIVKAERKLRLVNKLANMPPPPPRDNKISNPFTNDRVEILPPDHFTPKHKVSKAENDSICKLVHTKFSLNTEQKRAFDIVVAHATATTPQAPLKMYLGGMGGSGKSVVFKAIIDFFNRRNEEYRYMVVGPTGSISALLHGSTYHSVFRIPRESNLKNKNQDDIDGIRNDAATIASINERIQGVEYVLLDEISMLSCEDLQKIASQAAKARNIHDVAFGGLNMIFAGDFAQLPPLSGKSLYSGLVSLSGSTAMDVPAQNSVLGRILWHQFTTVIILRQNMRQTQQTDLDAKLRTALENMRYGACTADDLEFLDGRVASNREGFPHLDAPEFKNASIITGRNIHRDLMNKTGAERFARETGQKLTKFYSIDKLTNRSVDKVKFKGCEQAKFRVLGKNLQNDLWDALPCQTSEHIAGCLQLCIGLPVMIKANDATELCITKGQAATVVGWNASTGPSGQKVLETLFVKLVNPPEDVQLPDLPLNVVPMVRVSTHLTALLRDDSLLALAREQVMILIYFGLTDYGSQGISRNPNVVHLNDSRDHRSCYVALSRGYKAAETVIVQAWPTKKVTSGMSGFLRQEFRDLELLDEITKLRSEGKLPLTVTGIYRGQLIASYRKWRGANIQESSHFHKALRWNSAADDANYIDYGEWTPTADKPAGTKRKAGKLDSETPSKKKKPTNMAAAAAIQYSSSASGVDNERTATAYPSTQSTGATINCAPIGLIWDSRDHSCSYDALLTPLACLLKQNPGVWTDKLTECSPILGVWAMNLLQNPHQPEIARNALRTLLHLAAPQYFPMGPNPVVLDRLLMAVTSRRSYGTATRCCERCNYRAEGVIDTWSQLVDASTSRTLNLLYPRGQTISQWLAFHFDRTSGACHDCLVRGTNVPMRRTTTVHDVPALLMITINIPNMIIEHELCTEGISMRLVGMIYHSETSVHFTSNTVDATGTIWYHDGISTGRNCRYEGKMADLRNPLRLQRMGGERLCAVIYAKSDI
jgi:hypothetical protein